MIRSHKFFPKLCKDQTLDSRFRCLVEIVKYDSRHSGREKWCNKPRNLWMLSVQLTLYLSSIVMSNFYSMIFSSLPLVGQAELWDPKS